MIYTTIFNFNRFNDKKAFTFLALMLLLTTSVFAQTGKDGSVTITTVNTVLNRYTRVTADVVAGGNTVTVFDINELNRDGIGYLPAGFNTSAAGFTSNALAPGDLIMLYQAQGAIIDASNTLAYGSVTNYNGSGSYEFAYVESVAGNVITLTCTTKLSYFAARYVQVIRVPQYINLTVDAVASVVAIPWGAPTFGARKKTRRYSGCVSRSSD